MCRWQVNTYQMPALVLGAWNSSQTDRKSKLQKIRDDLFSLASQLSLSLRISVMVP